MKIRPTSYAFDASEKTIVCASFTSLEAILLITNVTDGIIIYNFADATKGGSLTGTTLTLAYDTTSMADADKLQIFVDDGATTNAVSGTVAVTHAALTELGTAIDTEMQVDVVTSALPSGAATSAKQDTIIGHVDGIETLIGTTNTTLTAIDGRVDGVEALLTTIDADTSNLSVVGGGTEATAVRVTIANNSTGVLSVDDNGGALTVDGTVTADLGATDNAVLDAIAASTAAIETAVEGTLTVTGGGGGTEYTEDAAAAANPVGTTLQLIREDARAGSLTTTDGDNVALRGNNKGEAYVKTTDSDALLTTIDVDTGNISTKIDTIAGAVAGTEVQVDVLTMPTVAVTGTFYQATQPVSVASVPSHAVTNAGTFAVQVDGSALTSLQLADDVVATLGTTTYTEASTKGTTIGAVRRDADTTLVDTTNEIGPLQMDANGRLKVEAFSGETLPVSLTSTTVTGTVAVTQSGTWDEVGINDSGNSITVDNAQLSVVGTGTEATAMRVTIASDSTGVLSVDDNGGALTVDGTVTANLAAGTNNIGDVDILSIAAGDNNIGNVDIVSGTITTVSSVTAIANALPAGTNAIGKLAANSGVDIGDVDITSISAGANAIGNVGLIGRTSGGLTIFRSIDIDESEEEVKATAGQLFSITAFNTTAAPLYLKFYNLTAANTTVGTSTPVLTFLVPGNADSDGAGFVWNNDIGFAFGTAISVACTTAIADADTGAPGANACLINIGYM